MFPGLRFGAPYFVWYGKDGAATVDNADKYVYAVANNGHFEDGDNYILGRVLKSKLPELNAADWQFYHGRKRNARRNWASDMNKAKPDAWKIRSNCSMTGMTYIPALGRYVMVVWHYTTYNLRTDPRTINDYYEAPKPWGPWTKFKTIEHRQVGVVCPDHRAEVSKGGGCEEPVRLPLRPGLLPEPESVQAELSAGDVFDRALASDPSALSFVRLRASWKSRFFLISTRYCSFQSVFCRVFTLARRVSEDARR